MGKTVKVTVVISIFNGIRFLEDCIASIMPQLKRYDEIICYDDGSSDESVSFLRSMNIKVYDKHSISSKFVLSSTGIQERITRNYFEMISLAKNDIIVLADQDDIWLPGKLDFIRLNPGNHLYIHDAVVINESGTVLFDSYMESIGGFKKSRIKNLIKNRFLGCTMAFNRNLILEMLPTEIINYMYHDQIIGLLLLGSKVVYEKGPYLKYRRHDNAVTTSGFKSQSSLRQKLIHRLTVTKIILRNVKSIARQ